MTATYRRSKDVAKRHYKTKKKYRPAPPPPTEYFTPTSPEPYPFWAMIEDWNRGIIPGNNGLLKFLESWRTSGVLANDPKLSEAGRTLVGDLRELGVVFTRVIKERNQDELIQRFIGHLRLASRVLRTGVPTGRISVVNDVERGRRVKLFGRRDAQVKSETGDQLKSLTKDAKDLLNLAQLLITSEDFRLMITETQRFFQRVIDMRGTGSTNTLGTPQTTMPTSAAGATAEELRYQLEEAEEEINEINEIKEIKEPLQGEEYKVIGRNKYSTSGPTVEIYKAFHKNVETAEPSNGTPLFNRPERRYQESRSSKASIGRESSERPPVAATPRTPSTSEQDKLLEDGKTLFRRLSENQEFKEAMVGIYTIFTRWQSQASNVPGRILSSDLQYDANLAAARNDLLDLAQRFANGASLRPILQSIKDITREAKSDYELNDFFMDWKTFLLACTKDPGYLEHDEYLRRGRYLLNRTTEYSDKKYRKLFNENLDNWKNFLQGWQNDKLTLELSHLTNKIVQEDFFGRPSGGRAFPIPTIQPSLVTDFRNVIIPALLRSLYEFPLPHIEIEQDGMRISLDNVVLPAALLAPADLDFVTSNRIRVSPRERLFGRRKARKAAPEEGRWKSGTHILLDGMKGEINHVKFALDRTSWPRIRDRGTCDVRLGGNGMSIAVDVATDVVASQRLFHIEPVYIRVKLDRLRIKFYDVQHDTFFAICRPYLQSTLKNKIEKALRDRIVDVIYQVDAVANRLAKNVQV